MPCRISDTMAESSASMSDITTSVYSGQEATVQVMDRQVLISTTLGNGVRITVARRNLEAFDVEVDPHFFDEGYTIAGSTGFLLWGE